MIKILIVDDNLDLRTVYEDILKQAGYEVVTAVDGEDGIAKIYSEKPQLVLLDLMMPKKTGFEVLEVIKKDPVVQNIPVVILTDILADSEDFISKGAIGFILKSNYTPPEIISKIQAFLHEAYEGTYGAREDQKIPEK